MPSVTTEPRLAAGLRISVMRLARRLRAQRSDSGLTLSQLAALATLDRHGPLSLSELAGHEKVSPPSMTRVVSHLVDAGLVDRSPHPSDGRQVSLAASAAGSRLLTADRRRREEWLSAQLAALPPADLDALRRALPVLDRLAGS